MQVELILVPLCHTHLQGEKEGERERESHKLDKSDTEEVLYM